MVVMKSRRRKILLQIYWVTLMWPKLRLQLKLKILIKTSLFRVIILGIINLITINHLSKDRCQLTIDGWDISSQWGNKDTANKVKASTILWIRLWADIKAFLLQIQCRWVNSHTRTQWWADLLHLSSSKVVNTMIQGTKAVISNSEWMI